MGQSCCKDGQTVRPKQQTIPKPGGTSRQSIKKPGGLEDFSIKLRIILNLKTHLFKPNWSDLSFART